MHPDNDAGCIQIFLRFITYLRGWHMIELTRLNGSTFTLNSDLIEIVEETPDTVITLSTGRKFVVKESRQEIKNLVKSYKKEIFSTYSGLQEE